MEEIPVGSRGPPKLVSNSALFRQLQREQVCESARAVLALLSALGISLFSQQARNTKYDRANLSLVKKVKVNSYDLTRLKGQFPSS